LDDVGAAEAGGRLRLALEADLGVVELVVADGDELDRDGLVERDVPGDPDRPHASSGEGALEPVFPGDDSALDERDGAGVAHDKSDGCGGMLPWPFPGRKSACTRRVGLVHPAITTRIYGSLRNTRSAASRSGFFLAVRISS